VRVLTIDIATQLFQHSYAPRWKTRSRTLQSPSSRYAAEFSISGSRNDRYLISSDLQ
jgi:hypothetical protein